MIKDIIEKMKNDDGSIYYMDDYKIDGYNDAVSKYLPNLEKSAEKEAELIKALVKVTRQMCHAYCNFDKCTVNECLISGYEVKLLETHTGKKWDEIKEVYR